MADSQSFAHKLNREGVYFMGDSLRYKDWFEKAAHDLRGAEILMEHDGGNDLVAFHCQQAMEKMLKGWLLKTTGELLDGHSLVFCAERQLRQGHR